MFIARQATRTFTRRQQHLLRPISITAKTFNKMSEEDKKQIKTAFPVSRESGSNAMSSLRLISKATSASG